MDFTFSIISWMVVPLERDCARQWVKSHPGSFESNSVEMSEGM